MKTKTKFESAQIGDKFFYPATNGRALICHVLGKSEHSVVVKVSKKDKIYLEKDNWEEYAVPLPKIDIYSVIEDPENKLVYIRYRRTNTWVDRLYNWYCKKLRKNDI